MVSDDKFSMYREMLTDHENTIILLCKHMRRLLTLLEACYDMEAEERFLSDVEQKNAISEKGDNSESI